jgi:hypothetical protein
VPYITAEARQKLATGQPATGPGELNYLVTMTVLEHVRRGGRQKDMVNALVTIIQQYEAYAGESYTTINAVVGVLHCARMELLRRTIVCGPEAALLKELATEYYAKVAAPYEDGKLAANGDLPYAESVQARSPMSPSLALQSACRLPLHG